MNYPTDLIPEEEKRARARLADLAEQFTAKRILRTPVWREVFERTWRHPYVPGYYPDKDAPCVLSVDPAQRSRWLDIDPELVDLARERLAANGHTPTLAAVDGQAGYPPGAPYDRIISTCAVPTIPDPWLAQSAPGAVILTDVRGSLGGTLARLTVDEHGTAVGRFLPHWAGFMTMRHAVDQAETFRPWVCEPSSQSMTSIDPAPLTRHGLFGFIVQWHLPAITRAHTLGDDGQPMVDLVAEDGSRAEITLTPGPAGYRVRQYGPQRLWDRVEQAVTFWHHEGRPSYDRFGITATPHNQHIWYDNPNGPHRWPL